MKPTPRQLQVIKIISELSVKQQSVLMMRYFGTKEHPYPMTLEEVGKLVGGVSREAVRDLEDRGLRIIEENLNQN